jgi:cellulose biosynthesis protein BcsQ
VKRVVAVASNKGGVGKTTIATNLAIYLRALLPDLPVLILGLDDQRVIDRMFALGPAAPGAGNLKHGWAEHCLDRVITLGQFGIHFVPTPPDTGPLKSRARDPRTLARILERSAFDGLVIVDTKSDLEELTANALAAADLAILPIADRASFEETAKSFALLERLGRPQTTGRVLLTLVDRRTRVDREGRDLHDRLLAAVDQAGWPRFETHLSRSPRVEALNSAGELPRSILHHGRGTATHRQLRELAEEVAKCLDLGAEPRRELRVDSSQRRLARDLRSALLRNLGGRR